MKNFEAPRLLDAELAKDEHQIAWPPIVIVVFVLSILIILMYGGFAFYCVSKGGSLYSYGKLTKLTYKVYCKLPRRR